MIYTMSHHAAVMRRFHKNGATRYIFAGSGEKAPSHPCSNSVKLGWEFLEPLLVLAIRDPNQCRFGSS